MPIDALNSARAARIINNSNGAWATSAAAFCLVSLVHGPMRAMASALAEPAVSSRKGRENPRR
jgi:hypothetical protein